MKFCLMFCSLVLVVCAAPQTAPANGSAPSQTFVATPSHEGAGVQVHVGGALILEIKPGALLRMRCTPTSDRWMGYENHDVKLGWAPNHKAAVDNVKLEVVEAGQKLRISVKGTKPQMPGAQFTATVTGEFDARGRVRYQIASDLDTGPANATKSIEYLDIWYDRIFWPEKHRGTPELYREFVYGTPAGVFRAPKLHVYTESLTPKFETPTLTQPIATGSFFAVVDPRSGGLISRVDHMSSKGAVGVCWWAWDPHFYLYTKKPQTRFEYRMTIEELDADEATQLLKTATPIDLAAEPAYQLPVFVVDGVNEFDRPVRAPADWTWERTSLDVSVDTTTGYGDSESATIRRTEPGRAAWFGRQLWIDPWRQRLLEGRHRFTAMVKTKDVAEGVNLSIVQYPSGSQLLYKVASPKVVSSRQLRGTNDWTELSVDFEITEANAMAVLEQLGPGQSWFDDARIVPLCDPVGEAAPRVAFHARTGDGLTRRRIDLSACTVNNPGIRGSLGKLTMAWKQSEARIPRVTLPRGKYQLVIFANTTGCPDDPPRLRVDGLPGVQPVVALRPNARDDYVVEFTLDRRSEIDPVLTFVNDGPCGAGVDKNIEVYAITLAWPR